MVPQHRGLHVGSGVSFPVPVLPAFPWHRPLQGRRQIPPHIRIRPFLDRHSRGRVGNKNMEQAVPPTASGGGLLQ